MDSSLVNQTQEVKKWLHEVFGQEDIPDFEVNYKTIEYLHNLMLESRERDRHLQLVTKDFQQKTCEYKAEAHRLSQVLHRLQVTPDSLSQSAQSSLTTLTRLGMLLQVRNPSNTCFLLALVDLDREIERVEGEVEAETEALNKFTTSYKRTLHQCNSLNKVIENSKIKAEKDAQLNAEKEAETSFFFKKGKYYLKEVEKKQKLLKDRKLDGSLLHEKLVKKSEALKEIQDKLGPLRAKLESYSILPPDLKESKIKLAEYKREVEELDKQLSACIANTNL